MDKCAAAVAIILAIEGAPSNDPNDPGGETVYGISRRAHPKIPWPPTLAQAVDIYRSTYWAKHNCDELPWPWALGIFDTAVNEPAAVPYAQEALGLKPDGDIGPVTIAALLKASTERFAYFMMLRAKRYAAEPDAARYDDGWTKRLMQIAYAAGNEPMA
jgi:lysozyme family protein